ncbi:interferon-induced GTP-binding protein Mx2-like isoform X2 [Alosa sapidissima]|uniref:interferon-induced GTP-binding protein Mx2-like isoform X2 n=1 Tax=Alosa sapidissima TaxID=34773 RepID=UPI001C096D3C|nr:interferon-induced GTP-binding protein Mx2-like isoform X2 [Alosa sapidissima]
MTKLLIYKTMDQWNPVDSDEEMPSLTEERTWKIFNKEMEGVFHGQLNERVRPYLDLIDSLRLMGIDEDLALPAIAVIGDQSSGKSSVLEALSGITLPRGSGIVTRCPLMLKLRKLLGGVQWKAIISYKDTSTEFSDPSLVEQYVVAAQNELAGDGVGICDELISLEIMSPEVCDLTLIDLPGIARVPVKGQPEDIGDQIKRLILSFIEKSETINLVVVPCNVDIATTEALKMAQEVDPDGKRTLAILTKPDLIDRGTEKNVLDIVHNRVIPLSKGYIVVKCRGQQQIQDKTPLAEATRMERDFFRQHKYFSCLLNEDKATTQCLATKLTQDLVDHIKKALPTLSEQVKMELWESRKFLNECPEGPPSEPQQKKTYLVDILTLFNDKINNLSAGEVVNEENLFVILRSHFQKWSDELKCSQESFAKTMQDVEKEYDLKHRGRELPGFSDYKVFETVVQRLMMKLLSPALETLKVIRETVQVQFIDVSKTCFSNYPFLHCVAMNKIDKIQSKQETKVEERIREQFQMEQLVYTQDTIYFKSLTKMEDATPVNWADYDSRNKYPDMFQAYYEIVIQRLADQIPMLIRFFLLKQSARFLCSEMLSLMEGVDLKKALCESSDGSRHRHDLKSRIERLSLAQEKLSRFL